MLHGWPGPARRSSRWRHAPAYGFTERTARRCQVEDPDDLVPGPAAIAGPLLRGQGGQHWRGAPPTLATDETSSVARERSPLARAVGVAGRPDGAAPDRLGCRRSRWQRPTAPVIEEVKLDRSDPAVGAA